MTFAFPAERLPGDLQSELFLQCQAQNRALDFRVFGIDLVGAPDPQIVVSVDQKAALRWETGDFQNEPDVLPVLVMGDHRPAFRVDDAGFRGRLDD